MFHLVRVIACIVIVVAVRFSEARRVYMTDRRKPINYGPEISFLKIDKVWEETNITGMNVVVAVLDDGVRYNHKDLSQNFKSDVSYDFVDNNFHPFPSSQSTHGTSCAGIIASKLGGRCRTGVAFNANLAGIRIFSKSEKHKDVDRIVAKGLRHKKNQIDIFSNSWGPSDNGYSIRGPGRLTKKALKDGALQGRNGLGSIFVFSSGNGGYFGDSCAFDGYVNSIYTIAVGAVTRTGDVPRYAESCSSVIASTYGDGVRTSGLSPSGCDSNFGKTSGAAAFASGIIALLLEANKKLTWRDVQHLIIRTSNPNAARNDKKWITNGSGLKVHPSIGFGVMDAKKLVDVAKKWTNVPQQMSCSFERTNIFKTLNRDGATFSLPVAKQGRTCSSIKALEHVQIEVSLSFFRRAFILMYLQSPAGTKSQMLYHRRFDSLTKERQYQDLTITSMHFWGEDPNAGNGEWKVLLNQAYFYKSRQVKVRKVKITLYGTSVDPSTKNTKVIKAATSKSPRRSSAYVEAVKVIEEVPTNVRKVKTFPVLHFCGPRKTYNTNYQECCRRTNTIVEKNPRCGIRIYSKCTSFCCNGQLYPIASYKDQKTCCGLKVFSKSTHICCGGVVYPKSVCELRKMYSFYIGWYRDWYVYDVKCLSNQRVNYVPKRQCWSWERYGYQRDRYGKKK